MIAIVDYGAGNLRSVSRALEHAVAAHIITDDPDAVAAADGVILPGVGSAGDAIAALDRRGLSGAVTAAAERGVPLLGVCLGLQLLFDWSEEGDQRCLGLLPGVVRRLPAGPLKVPHMGWNRLWIERRHALLDGVEDGSYAYFVHSYVAESAVADVVARCEYGVTFPAVVARGLVMGTQFHPEKSGADGLRMYANFAAMVDAVPAGAPR